MGKISIVVVGTHGEVRPLVALGTALRDAGHDVLLCAPPNEKDWIARYGLDYRSTGCDINELIRGLNKYMGHPLKLIKAFKRTLNGIIGGQFRLLDEIKDSDLIIGSGEPYSIPSIAEKYHIPYVFVNLVTQFMPSSKYPPTAIPWQNMPKGINRVCWFLINKLMNYSLLGKLNEQRAILGLCKIKDFYRHFLSSFDLCIIAVNDILDKLPKYKFNYIQTGLWHVPELEDEVLDPKLTEFLESGPAPVYIGFGSMSDPNPEETSRIIEETVNRLGCRAIISNGWANLCKNIDSKNTYMIGFAPHKELFPKVAAVVHHGGAGTVYTAAWAGVPQVIVPHMLDHYYQAALLYRKELIPKAVERSKLTSEKLSEEIKKAMTNEDIRQNSEKIGIELRKVDKDSLKRAVEAIEGILKKSHV